MSEGQYGPKMEALTDMMRAFVEATFAFPGKNPTEWARQAGYAEGDGLRVTAHRLWHDRRIQDAILEEAKRRYTGLVPLAQDRVVKVLLDPSSSGGEVLKAAQMINDRGGLHAVTEQHVTHTHIADDREKLARLEVIARKLNMPLDKLVGRSVALPRPAVDAEFAEVYNLEDLI